MKTKAKADAVAKEKADAEARASMVHLAEASAERKRKEEEYRKAGWMQTKRLKLQRIGRKNYPTRKFTHSAEARESESFLQTLKTKPFRQPTACRQKK